MVLYWAQVDWEFPVGARPRRFVEAFRFLGERLYSPTTNLAIWRRPNLRSNNVVRTIGLFPIHHPSANRPCDEVCQLQAGRVYLLARESNIER